MTDTRPAPDTADLIARLEHASEWPHNPRNRDHELLREAAAALSDLSVRLAAAESCPTGPLQGAKCPTCGGSDVFTASADEVNAPLSCLCHKCGLYFVHHPAGDIQGEGAR